MNIAKQEIALWLQPITEEKIINEEQVLSKTELDRYHRFQRPAKRAELLCSRFLLYQILQHYLPEIASSIETIVDEMGRPFWYFQGNKVPLYFSLSHTKTLVACAVASTPEIGCDVELIRPRKYEQELTARVFGQQELRHYKAQSSEATARKFFYQSWTLKEAYLKATGVGLRTPLPTLDFSHTVPAASFSRATPATGDKKEWWFFHAKLPQNFSLAIATTQTTPRLCGTIPSRYAPFPV